MAGHSRQTLCQLSQVTILIT
ncbi:hypothetical protein VTP21DRAFT_5822 [Calcarisporiella thermophila]